MRVPGSNTKKRRIHVIEHGGSARVEVAAGQLANDPQRAVSLGEHRLAAFSARLCGGTAENGTSSRASV